MGPLDVGWWTEHSEDDDDLRRRGRRARAQRRDADGVEGADKAGHSEDDDDLRRRSRRIRAQRGDADGVDGGDVAGPGEDDGDGGRRPRRTRVQRRAAEGATPAGTAAPAGSPGPSSPGSSSPGAATPTAAKKDVTVDQRAAPGGRAARRRAAPAAARPARPPTAGDRVRPPTAGDRVRMVIRGIGQTLITLGLVVLLFVVYELWVTDLMNARTQHKLGSTLQRQWNLGDDPLVGAGKTGPRRPGEKITRIPLGSGIANIYIPSFGTDYVFTIVEGTNPGELEEGPGHYVDTALPGEVGNFAVAGHRVGKGSPFLNLDKLRTNDAIVIETKDYWYTYRVLGNRQTRDPRQPGDLGIKGLQIVDPGDRDVILPVPDRPGAAPSLHLLTLTTCHPKFSARERLIIHAQQEGQPLRKLPGVLPPALKG